MSSPQLVASPPDSAFIPRKEFLNALPVPSTFSLLAFAGPNFIRFSNFPDPTLRLVYNVLESRGLVKDIKEDREAGLTKFVLAGKPWSSPKGVESEALVVQVLAAILSEGYQFLSLVDYAKEAGDILSLVFSKPVTPESPAERPEMCHVPFGLSFVSSTIVRVVNPPLAHTPAILKAVREAWPRGTISERKVGNAIFEFKLKGYSWLKEDTFYEDSMNHVLALLSSLSLLGFNLLTSLSFTPGRSGVKDFWVMVGVDVRPDTTSIPSMSTLFRSSTGETRNASLSGGSNELLAVPTNGHRRSATVPTAPPSHHREWSGAANDHPRGATDPRPARSPPRSPPAAAPRSPLAKTVPLDLPQDVATNDGADAISWEGSDRAPSPLAHSPEDEDVPTTPPLGAEFVAVPSLEPKTAAIARSVHITDADSPQASFYAPIEEAPDLRASQIVYATPAPPRLSPPALGGTGHELPIFAGGLPMPMPSVMTPGSPEIPGMPPFPGTFPNT